MKLRRRRSEGQAAPLVKLKGCIVQNGRAVCASKWQAFGNLRNGSEYGLCYANLDNRLGNTNWNYGARDCG